MTIKYVFNPFTGALDSVMPGGEQGEKGNKGEPNGPKGEAGLQGEKGEQGEKGIPGTATAKGDKGDAGIAIKGDSGEKGDVGPEGPKGEQGLVGEKGEPGEFNEDEFKGDQQRQDDALAQEIKDREDADDGLQGIFTADQSRQDSEIAGERAINETQTNQINALETQIQLLGQVKATGTWTYERNILTSLRPPNLKKFYGTDVDNAVDNVLTDWGKLRLIMISKTSMEDKTFTFSAFEEGDKVEILSKDGTSACIGTVTNDPTNDSYGNFVVTVEYYKGGPVEGQEYLFSAYRPGANSGDVDLDILDQRYLQLTGGTLSSSLKIQRGEEKTHIQYKISPSGGLDYATNIYTLEGQMRLRTSHTGLEADAKGSHIMLDPDVANDGANPTTKIYKVPNPHRGDMASNKQYVDDAVAGLATEAYVDNKTDGLAAETYVDQKAAEIISGITPPDVDKSYVDKRIQLVGGPANMKWAFEGSRDSTDDPGTGKMYYHPGGHGSIQGYLRFSFVDLNGINLGDGKFGDTNVTMDYGPIGTIWQYRYDIDKWKLQTQFRVQAWRWNFHNHFELGISGQNGREISSLASMQLFVTVGGLF